VIGSLPRTWTQLGASSPARSSDSLLQRMTGSIVPLVCAALLLLPACDQGQGATENEVTTAASPSGASETSPSEEPEDLLPILTGPCCGGFPLDEGRHETPPWFAAPFSIEVGERLSGVAAEPEQIVEIGRGRSSSGSLDHYVAFFAVEGAERVMRGFRSMRQAQVGSAEPFRSGDLEGSQVEATAKSAPDDPTNDEIATGAIRIAALDRLTPGFFYTESRRARMRLIAIEHGSIDLVVYIEAPSRGFEDFAEEVGAMLGSIVFLDR
jgi:hypothetical protein